MKKKNSLKKIEIYEKGIETNKIKYERQIKNNQNIINELNNEKKRLLYYYKELIGEEKFRNLIQAFKEENKDNENNSKNKNKIEDNNIIDNKTNKEDNIIINENKENNIENNIITLKDNNNINNIKENKNEKKYPEFLDFFKEEEENNDNINDNINENKDINEYINNDKISTDKEQKDEKEINIAKFEEINNSMSNRNKEYEDEPPPNEYEDLEEFQI